MAIKLALTGVMAGQSVDIVDEAPTSIYELVGGTVAPAAEPLADPRHLHVDASRARRLGFQPTVRTVHQAVLEGLM